MAVPKKKAAAKADLSVKTAKKAAPEADTPTTDLDWLDEGTIGLDESDIDPEQEEMPGRLESLSVDVCRPNAWNPNEQTPKEMDMLTRRIREVGMIAPIQVVPAKDKDGTEYYTIIGGEHRWRATKSLGYKNIPAIILTEERFQSEDLQKFVTMQLNMIGGKLNPEKFVKMYETLTDKYDDESMQDLMGFTQAHAFKMLTKGVADGLPDDMKSEFNKKAAKADRPEQLTNILNELLGKYGDDLRFNFMIFTHEDKEHIWCRLSDENHKLVGSVLDLCRSRAIDVNVVVEEAFQAALKKFS